MTDGLTDVKVEQYILLLGRIRKKKLQKGHQTAHLNTVAKVTALASTFNFELQTLAKLLSNCCKVVINALLNTNTDINANIKFQV